MDSLETPASLRVKEGFEKSTERYREELIESGWWHSIDLGNGNITKGVNRLEDLQAAYARFGLPDDLKGKRVLDIGCWDGFYTFEAERHGAEVVAVDCFQPENFFNAHEVIGSRAEFKELSVYELAADSMGQFDFVLFLGVLYHLEHPLLGLKRVCEVTRDTAIIGSYIIDNLVKTSHRVMEFYPLDELGGQHDNWWGPNGECLVQMIRAAGFVEVEWIYNDLTSGVVKASRHWRHPDLKPEATLTIREVANSIYLDQNLVRRGRFAFLSIWVEGLPDDANRKDIRVEVGGFGCSAVYVEPALTPEPGSGIRINRLTPARLNIAESVVAAAREFVQIIVPVPPGLSPGPAAVVVYHKDAWSPGYPIELKDNSFW